MRDRPPFANDPEPNPFLPTDHGRRGRGAFAQQLMLAGPDICAHRVDLASCPDCGARAEELAAVARKAGLDVRAALARAGLARRLD